MATVNAVCRAVVEIPVRASDGGETMDDLMKVAQREGEQILRHMIDKCNEGVRVLSVEFSHATVRSIK